MQWVRGMQEKDLQRWPREVQMLQKMSHSNVVKFHQVFYEKCFVCIIMDKHPGGDILAGMKAARTIPWQIQLRSVKSDVAVYNMAVVT